jgi:serine/threonine protein kinase
MCKAIGTLHERNIIHRDKKLENIFITKDNNFKLGNNCILYFLINYFFFFFGWSLKKIILLFFLLIRRYQAPEIVNEEKYCLSMYFYLLLIYIARYGKAADVYSFGIVLYILISGGGCEYKIVYLQISEFNKISV